MKLLHNITISVFCKPEEDEVSIREKLLELVDLDLEQEKIQLQQQNAKGFSERTIKIFSITLDKQRHVKHFMKRLNDMLTQEQKDLILRQADSRLDDNMFFYLRLDKDKLLQGNCWLTDSGNCYHVKLSVAAYPAKREIALESIKKLFSDSP